MPLFDRLVDLEPRERRLEAMPRRTFDRHQLRESVRRELANILSSRSPLPAAELPAEGDALQWRTSLDFGLPALVSFSPASSDDRRALADIARRAIEAYEPRLQNVQTRVVAAPARRGARGERLRLEIDARLLVGSVDEPISFTTVLDSQLLADRETDAVVHRRETDE